MSKHQLRYDSLNESQKKAYRDICEFLNTRDHGVITIDSQSGTGKTYLLSTLAATYDRLKLLVFRKDQASKISLQGVSASTYASFVMHHFNLKYREASRMFSMTTDVTTELYKLLIYSKKFVSENTKIIEVDSCTIPTPAMLLLFYILSLQNKLHLIFAGNGMQLGAIGKSILHNRSNFHLINVFKDKQIKDLNRCMQMTSTYENKLSHFHEMLLRSKCAGDVTFNFSLRYHLYLLFRDKYSTKERFDTVYIAPTHKKLTARLHRFIRYLDSEKIPYVEVPFYKGEERQEVLPPKSKILRDKFHSRLLLVEKFKYIHIDEKGVHSIVELKKIVYKDKGVVDSLIVRFLDNNKIKEIYRVKLNYFQILPAYRKWLLHYEKDTYALEQFPLRPYMLTYHAALGRTFDEEIIELNVDCDYGNFVYIGLCSVCDDSSINRIDCEKDLESYKLTYYMETQHGDKTYYYRCPSKKSNLDIGAIDLLEVNSVHDFEQKYQNYYVRIKRSMYDKEDTETDTPLMNIARFVKEKPNVIRHTIATAPVYDFIGEAVSTMVRGKGKKKENQQQPTEDYKTSDAFVHLEAQYKLWLRDQGLDK